jgi:hypothetical protein
MAIAQKIHDKLITDFQALTFENDSTLFTNVKKFYASQTMQARDCLIIPDTNDEQVLGGSAGNTSTTRNYGFNAIVIEAIKATDSDSEGSLKYSRLLNEVDEILDYIQKEPSNLNSWGATNNIDIFKIRLRQVFFNQELAENGYVEVANVQFNVYLNVTPQLL